MHKKYCRVVYVYNGGFNGSGAINDAGDMYQKSSNINIRFSLKYLRYKKYWNSYKNDHAKDGYIVDDGSYFFGKGYVTGFNGGNEHKLSIFGSEEKHDIVDIIIRKNSENRCGLFPMKSVNSVDLKIEERFAIQVDIKNHFFDNFKNEYFSENEKDIKLDIKLSDMSGLYSKWSPSISESRILKFLHKKSDVDNFENMPSNFDDFELSDDNLQFTLSIEY